jgi:hypothetical protein
MPITSFADLKKKRRSIDDLQEKVEKLGSSKYQNDDRFWAPTADKSGNGSAVIRFLPAAPGEDEEWVTLYRHSFKGPTGKWYIENSRTTIGGEDPVSKLNSQLWNSGNERDKATASIQKRKLTYISNIYVVKDPKHPENEGKVFLFRYGQSIFDMIKNALKPEFEDMEMFDPFDPFTGAPLRLRFRNKSGKGPNSYRTYEDSAWGERGPVVKDEDDLETIWKSQHLLAPLVAPDQFKSYEELEARLRDVLMGDGNTKSVDDEEEETPRPKKPRVAIVEDEDEDEDVPEVPIKKSRPTPAKKVAVVEEDDEDSSNVFQSLLDDED